ncbi:MAG: restriction endonuclease subunit S [Flavobacteriales bacterium]|nr:restriction endonuclease subunit S [Flavobacteriales bacterium]
MFKAKTYVGHKLCWPEDLVINSLWAWGRGLGFSKEHGIISTAYGVYRLREPHKHLWQYLNYTLRSSVYQWELQVRSKGVWKSRLQLTDASFFDMPILMPPKEDAELIVRYLHALDAKVKRYIRTKRTLIARLQEQKQAIIQRAVTRGLDPNAKLKPSGVEWLMAASYIGHKLCWPEDLVINSLWAWAKGFGFSKHHGIVSTAYSVYRLRPQYKRLWRYLDVLLRSGAYDWDFTVRSRGVWKSRLQLTDSSFLDMRMILPSAKEADEIVEYIRTETKDLDEALSRVNKEIEVLQEYHTRLISDVVTGAVDVREAAKAIPEWYPWRIPWTSSGTGS